MLANVSYHALSAGGFTLMKIDYSDYWSNRSSCQSHTVLASFLNSIKSPGTWASCLKWASNLAAAFVTDSVFNDLRIFGHQKVSNHTTQYKNGYPSPQKNKNPQKAKALFFQTKCCSITNSRLMCEVILVTLYCTFHFLVTDPGSSNLWLYSQLYWPHREQSTEAACLEMTPKHSS